MNKVISTQKRVFMCICGSTGSGKTRLIFDSLTRNSEDGGIFRPQFKKIVYYYRYWQPIYDHFQEVPCQIFVCNCKVSASFQKSKEHQNKNETRKPLKPKHEKSRYSSVDIDSLIEEIFNHQSSVSDSELTKTTEKV